MDPRVFDAKDSAVVTEDKGASSAFHEEARAWMSQRPEPAAARQATNCGDKCNDKVAAKFEGPETPEVKEAYKNLLDKTKGVDPATVADSINLFADLAATGGSGSVSNMAQAFEKEKGADKLSANAQFSPETVNSNAVEPAIAGSYMQLLQRGFNPTLITDVLNVAGDVAAIAMSPQGRKLFEDVKSLISHIRG